MKKLTIKEIAKLGTVFGKLKKVRRTGWVLQGISDAESVAEHTWRVSMLAMVLAPQYNMDHLKVLKMAMIHDLGEAIAGDIKWEEGDRVIASQQEKHQDEYSAMESIFGDNSELHEYLDLWHEFNDQRTAEAKFVKELDKLEMVMQASEYQDEGYSPDQLDQFWNNANKYLRGGEFEKLFAYLKRERDSK